MPIQEANLAECWCRPTASNQLKAFPATKTHRAQVKCYWTTPLTCLTHATSAVRLTLSKSQRYSKHKALSTKLHRLLLTNPLNTLPTLRAPRMTSPRVTSSCLRGKSSPRSSRSRAVSTPSASTRPSWSQCFWALRRNTWRMQLISTTYLSENFRPFWPRWSRIKTIWLTRFWMRKRPKETL